MIKKGVVQWEVVETALNVRQTATGHNIIRKSMKGYFDLLQYSLHIKPNY
jgi:hypothetical protein